MTKLTLIKPEIGQKNLTEEPKVSNAFTAIEQWANGEIDSTNIKNESLTEEDFATAVKTLLNQKSSGLSVVSHAISATAVSGELALMTKTATTLELPAPTLNANVGVYYAESAGSITVKASTGAIAGDFTSATSVKLLANQHLLLTADGVFWRIMAGEPKREQTYEAVTERAAETAFTASATRETFVIFSVQRATTGIGSLRASLKVGGTAITRALQRGAAENEDTASCSFLLPAGQTWEWQNLGGVAKGYSTYLPR